MRGVLANLLLTIVSLVFGLLIFEAGLRLTGFQPGNPLARLINHPDSVLGYRMLPGMRESVEGPGGVYDVETVSLGFDDGIGFRDDGITPPVQSVFIGDSFVWGYGVNLTDSISERFETITGQDAVNLGMTSWTSPTQYARILEKYGTRLQPRYAFMEALVENDFSDGANFSDWEASGTGKSYPEWMTDRVMHYSPDTLNYKIRRLLYDHSSLGRFVSERVQFGIKAPASPAEQQIVHVTEDGLNLYLNPRALPLPAEEPDVRQIALFRTALLESRATADARAIRLVVFVVPTKEMVYQDRFPDPAMRAAVDWRYNAIKKLVDEEQISHVDMLPPFRAAAAQGQQLYYADDTHWTPSGHELAARVLRDYVTINCRQSGCAP